MFILLRKLLIMFNKSLIESTIYTWVRSIHPNEINFVGDFVASNVINLKVNGSAITPVTYTTSHANTMLLLAAAIAAKTSLISSAIVGTSRQIIIKGLNDIDIDITDIIVTSGATQTTGVFTKSVPVFFLGDNANRPDSPCISIRLISDVEKTSFRKGSINNTTGEVVTFFSRICEYSFVAYGPTCWYLLSKLTSYEGSYEQYKETMRASVGLSVLRYSTITDISGMNGTYYEERAQVNISFTYGEEKTEVVGIIEDSEITGEIDINGDLNTITIEVNI